MTPEMEDTEVAALFGGLRRHGPEPGEALLARIEADGLAEQRVRREPLRLAVSQAPWWLRWLPSPGGGAAVAGLVDATVAGLWLGLVQPAPVFTVTDSIAAVFKAEGAPDYADLIPFFDPLTTEG